MKQRLITGIGYVAVIIGFFLLKIYLPDQPLSGGGVILWGDLSFDLLLYVFSIVGTYEMIRALGNRLTKSQRVVAQLFSIVFIPAYDISTYVFNYDRLTVMGVSFFAASVVLCSLLVLQYEKTSLESVGCALLACVYPTVIIGVMVLCNHFPEHSVLAMLFIFVISPCADSLAYVFGMLLGKKFPQKMAPDISPKKTVVGGIGGVVGGVLGAIILFFAYNLVTVGTAIPYEQLPVYILIGAGAALFTEFGDLVESAIKRKQDIKDMGKILPGHGGILDRIDGTMYTAVLIYAVFYVLLRINVF